MDISRAMALAGVKKIDERMSSGPVFIPVSDMGAYEKWDPKRGQYQVYDDGGIHVSAKTEAYFKDHVNKFETMGM